MGCCGRPWCWYCTGGARGCTNWLACCRGEGLENERSTNGAHVVGLGGINDTGWVGFCGPFLIVCTKPSGMRERRDKKSLHTKPNRQVDKYCFFTFFRETLVLLKRKGVVTSPPAHRRPPWARWRSLPWSAALHVRSLSFSHRGPQLQRLKAARASECDVNEVVKTRRKKTDRPTRGRHMLTCTRRKSVRIPWHFEGWLKLAGSEDEDRAEDEYKAPVLIFSPL